MNKQHNRTTRKLNIEGTINSIDIIGSSLNLSAFAYHGNIEFEQEELIEFEGVEATAHNKVKDFLIGVAASLTASAIWALGNLAILIFLKVISFLT
jgi:hypothetical protein